MKIEKQIRLIPTLDSDEISCIRETVKILDQVLNQMKEYDCDTLTCHNKYSYDISDVREIIDTLEKFENISEIIY